MVVCWYKALPSKLMGMRLLSFLNCLGVYLSVKCSTDSQFLMLEFIFNIFFICESIFNVLLWKQSERHSCSPDFQVTVQKYFRIYVDVKLSSQPHDEQCGKKEND